MNKLNAALVSLASVIVCAAALAGEGKELARDCFECHDESGFSADPMIPTLGGHSAFVMTDWMFIFADELRPCEVAHPAGSEQAGETENHCDLFAEMSEADMEAIAEYFASLPFKPMAQETDPQLVAAGKQIHDIQCDKCHTEGGSVAEDDSGILAGQSMPYLRKAMNDFMSGAREMPEGMGSKVEGLSEEQVEALVHYYGAQGEK